MTADPRDFALLFGGGRGDMTQSEIELEIEMSRLTKEDLDEVGWRWRTDDRGGMMSSMSEHGEIFRCSACGYETSDLWSLACGMWTTCQHYADARAAGTLPPVAERPGTPVPYE